MKQLVKHVIETSVRVLPFKQQVFGVIKPIHPPKRVWVFLRFRGKFKVEVNGSASFWMNNHGYGLENAIFWSGLYMGFGEEQSLKLWEKLCVRARTVLDIGSNVGVYSLVAKAVNSGVAVFGFEPVAHLYEKFKDNCQLNGFDISCMQCALSDNNGFANIHMQPGRVATASLNPNALRTEVERVEVRTLSNFIEANGLRRIDLIKIDVEGCEPQVLRGMTDYLPTMKPSIIIEILSAQVGTEVETLVKDCGYIFFNIDEIKGPVRQETLSIEGKSRHSRNFLLCTNAVAIDLGLN